MENNAIYCVSLPYANTNSMHTSKYRKTVEQDATLNSCIVNVIINYSDKLILLNHRIFDW